MGCVGSRQQLDRQQLFLKDFQSRVQEAIQVFYQNPDCPVQMTPILKSQTEFQKEPDSEYKVNIYFKTENFQQSGSFKIRGAYYKITKLQRITEIQNVKIQLRIVIASTGNHAAACALISKQINSLNNQIEVKNEEYNENLNQKYNEVDLIIFVPKNCSQEKLKKFQGFKVFQEGDNFTQTELLARKYSEENFAHYISPYNDIDIIAASATIGYEMQPNLYQSVGGGGLISGIAAYLKTIVHSNTKIIGVQPYGNSTMYDSIIDGQLIQNNEQYLIETLSEGTDGGIEADSITYKMCQNLVDDWVIVKNEDIQKAFIQLTWKEKIIVEGSAALAYAGCLQYLQQEKEVNKQINCCVILCGQNIGKETVQFLLK